MAEMAGRTVQELRGDAVYNRAHCNRTARERYPHGYNGRRYDDDDDDEWKTMMKTSSRNSRDLETNEFLLRSSKRPQLINARRARAFLTAREKGVVNLANAIIGRGRCSC